MREICGIASLLLVLVSILQTGHVRADTIAAIPQIRHRRRQGEHGFNKIDSKHAGRNRSVSSLQTISRGGGTTNASSSSRASKKQLQSMRLLYLTYYASLGALLPYLPVYFHSLGHPGSSIGILGAVKPLATFLVAPVWGILSDLSNNHVATLQFTFVSSVIFQLLVGVNSNLNYLIAAVFAAAVLNAPVKSLVDALILSKLTSEEDKHQFGRMRLWGQVGFGLGSSLVGSLLSAFPADSVGSAVAAASGPALEELARGVGARSALARATRDLLGKTRMPRGYEWAFLAHCVLSVPTLFCIRAFRPERGVGDAAPGGDENEGRPAVVTGGAREGLRLLAKNRDALVFLFLVFVVGTSSGCIENFAYVRVAEVGGAGRDMGALRLVSSLAGAPVFWFSGPATEALGVGAVLALSLLAYAARFLNYAAMTRPRHALPAEALRGATFAMFWSAGSTYAHRISPPGMGATTLLLMNAMYGGLGQSLGAIAGGKLVSRFGTVSTFVYAGVFNICFVAALVVYLASGKERKCSTPSIDP